MVGKIGDNKQKGSLLRSSYPILRVVSLSSCYRGRNVSTPSVAATPYIRHEAKQAP